jgi:hypothetical protein
MSVTHTHTHERASCDVIHTFLIGPLRLALRMQTTTRISTPAPSSVQRAHRTQIASCCEFDCQTVSYTELTDVSTSFLYISSTCGFSSLALLLLHQILTIAHHRCGDYGIYADAGRRKQKATLYNFYVFTEVTMKNGVFWDVMPCGCCKNRRFGGALPLLHQGDKNR